MPKLGMEPIRREALVKATIEEIGAQRSLDVTVAKIARRAGVSSALAHHYFGGKEDIFLAAMHHILATYAQSIRTALRDLDDPRARVEAIIRAGFEGESFNPETIAAWLNFYVMSQRSDRAQRLLNVYQRRLTSNLVYSLKSLVGVEAQPVAVRISAMIDGVYLRQALGITRPDNLIAISHVMAVFEAELSRHGK
ncbi:transcriptional regulator, TetR family [Poseidonocella pacifica]|uniref:HTH-type transcriptional regulator BetI n=1 Tax=Poseidonocella pacifica TaxID=871651 RepID=A0A1I0X4F2_9RHOB|nr:transcriptional regulator BetI [Poseidonocella pacifica]SFA95218.1 transcriptional regulator, TetR family [Poseidonocella pacifica]